MKFSKERTPHGDITSLLVLGCDWTRLLLSTRVQFATVAEQALFAAVAEMALAAAVAEMTLVAAVAELALKAWLRWPWLM